MRFIEASPGDGPPIPTVELTRRNLTVLLEKLDDPRSVRIIIDREHRIAVRAVEDAEHYAERPPGPMLVKGQLK